LFRYCQSIVYFDPEIPDRTFDLGVPEQKLDSPKVARSPVNQGSFSAPSWNTSKITMQIQSRSFGPNQPAKFWKKSPVRNKR
jgi:hypothetical protein